MSITKFNHNISIFTAKAEQGTPYKSLADMFAAYGPDASYILQALYTNDKGKYGPQPTALVTAKEGVQYYVNLPKHLLNDVSAMIKDSEVVNQINRGEAGFKIRTYDNRNGGKSFSVQWIDLTDYKLPF